MKRSDQTTREERLAARLRENLLRRKAQARGQGQAEPGQAQGAEKPALSKPGPKS